MHHSASAIDEAAITFHIIYTHGSVEILHPLLRSLLHWSRCRFRLIGNGISDDEAAFLQRFCAAETRAELQRVAAAGQILPHPQVLDQLLAACRDEFFAICDSDIVVDGPFLAELLQQLAAADAVFSGAPVTYSREACTRGPNVLHLYGRHIWAADGRVLGCTYLAIYRREALQEARRASAAGFNRAVWFGLPADLRATLARAGHVHHTYDTSRVMLSLMLAAGRRFAYHAPATLHHLSGYSRQHGKESSTQAAAAPTRRQGLRRQLRYWWFVTRYRLRPSAPINRIEHNAVYRYFRDLLDGIPLAEARQPASGDGEVDRRVSAAAQAISAARQLTA